MKTQFKLLMLITSTIVFAQKEQVFNKSFDTDKNTTAILVIGTNSVIIEKSPDDKFYVDYSIDFKNYSNRKKNNILNRVNVETSKENNHITLNDNSRFFNFGNPYFRSSIRNIKKNYISKNVTYNKKSIEKILSEINEYHNQNFFILYIKNSNGSEEEKQKRIDKYNKRTYEKQFIIKIPEHINLTIKAQGSTIRIKDNIENQISVRINNSTFIAGDFKNENNFIKANNSRVLLKSIKGGEIIFNDVNYSLIGSITNTKITSEFSRIEIGEINENIHIKDFYSNYWFHNWAENFKNFNIDAEYSKVNLFFPKSNYKLENQGFNTVLYSLKNASVKAIQNPNQEKNNLYSVNKGDSSNKILINIKHGIVRLDDDEIIIKN